MSHEQDYPIDRTGSLWDRIWRGRSSSHRRALTNAALHAARCATALGEAARLVDALPSDRREMEIAGFALQIRESAHAMMAAADHLQAEAAFAPPLRVTWWRRLTGRVLG